MYSADWILRLTRFGREARSLRGWSVPSNIWGLGVTSLLTDISSEMVVSILPAYLVVSGGLAPLALGIATGLHEGGPLLAAWLGGLVADRSARRKLTAGAGYALSAISRLGWLVMSSQTLQAIGLLVVGDRIGKAMRTAPRDAMISLSVPPARLAAGFGVHRALDAAGAALGPLLAFAILWRLPRRFDVIFFTSFVVAALGLAALALLVDEYPPDRRHRLRDKARLRWPDTVAAFGDRSVRPVLILAAAFSLVTVSDAFIYLALVQRARAGALWIPLLYTGTAIAFLLLAVPAGLAADRIGKRRVFVLGHTFLLLAYAAAFAGPAAWPVNAIGCVALLGAYYASSDGVLAAIASGVLPEGARALGLAWVATAVSLARLCNAAAFGLLWTRAGDRAAFLTFATALVVVLGFALARPAPDQAAPS